MRHKIIVFVDDKEGYKVKLKWLWKRMWLKLSEEEKDALDSAFDMIYKGYCRSIKEEKK